MHERALVAVGLGDQGRVRDDPFLGVGRDVRARLVDLAEAQREGRREEAGLLLHGRQVPGRGDLAAHLAGELLAVGVDEARLADAGRVELLEVAELMRDVAEVAALPRHLLLAGAGLGEHSGERRRVPGQQHDRARPREVALQRGAVLVGLRDERPLELGDVAIAIELGHAEGGGNQQDADDEGRKGERTHPPGYRPSIAAA